MAKDSFVGFQEKVEIPEEFQLLEIEELLPSSKNIEALFLLISDPTQISLWLEEVQSFDSRPGGKLLFLNGTQAICTTFNLGKEISFISDYFGNFSAKVIKEKNGRALLVKFALLTDIGEKKSEDFLSIISRLQEQL